MAIIKLTAPPKITAKDHTDYGPWLRRNFYEDTCAYCLLLADPPEIDHYKPRKFAEDETKSPGNLLLACRRCNGPAGKSDYHPQHKLRRHCKTGTFMVVDVRVDDFSSLFEIKENGEIEAKAGKHKLRGDFNITLLKLDLESATNRRREFLDIKETVENVLECLENSPCIGLKENFEATLTKLIPFLACRLLFFRAYGIPIKSSLLNRIQVQREESLNALVD